MGDDAAQAKDVSNEVKRDTGDNGEAKVAETAMSQEATGAQDAASILRKNADSGEDTVAKAGLPTDIVLTGSVEENAGEKPQNAEKGDDAGAAAKEAGKEIVNPDETTTKKHVDLNTGEGEETQSVDDAIKDVGKDLVDPESTNTKKHLDFETGKGSEATENPDKPENKPADKELEKIQTDLLKIFDGKSSPQGLLEATRDLAKHSPDGNLRLRISDNGSNSTITLQNSDIPGNRGNSNATYKQMTHMYVSKDGGRTRVALRGVERNDNGKFDQQRDKNGNHVEYGGTGLNTMKGIVQDIDGAKVEMTTKDGRKVEATFSKNDKGEVSVDVKEIKPEPKPEQGDKGAAQKILQDIYANPEKHLPNLTSEINLENPSVNDAVTKAGLVNALADLGVQSIKVTPKGQTEPITLRPVRIKGENGNPDTLYLGVDGERAFAAKISPGRLEGMDPNNSKQFFDKDVYAKINGMDWSGAKVEIDYEQLKDNTFVVPERGKSVPGDQAVKNINARIPQGELEAVNVTQDNAKAMEQFMQAANPGYDFPDVKNVNEMAQELLKPESGFVQVDTTKGGKLQPGDMVLLAPNGKVEATKNMEATAGFIRADGKIVVPVGDGSKFQVLGTPQQVEGVGFSGAVFRPKNLPLKAEQSADEKPEKKTDVGDDSAKKTDVGDDTAKKTDVGDDTAKKTDVGDDTAKKTDVGDDTAEKTDVPGKGKGNFDHLSVAEVQQRLNTAFDTFMKANQADLTGFGAVKHTVGEVSGKELEVSTITDLEKSLPERGFERIEPKDAKPGDIVVLQGKPPLVDSVGIINKDGNIQVNDKADGFENVAKSYDIRVYSPTNLKLARDAGSETTQAKDIVDPSETSTQKHLEFGTGETTDVSDKGQEKGLDAEQQAILEKHRQNGRNALNALFDSQSGPEVKYQVLNNMYTTGVREFDIAQEGQPPIRFRLDQIPKRGSEKTDPIRMSVLRPGQTEWEPYLHSSGPGQDETLYGQGVESFDHSVIPTSNAQIRFVNDRKLDFAMKAPEQTRERQEQRQDIKPEVKPQVSDVFKAPDKAKAQEHAVDAFNSLDGMISGERFPGYGDLDALAQSGINEIEFQNPDGSSKYALKLSHDGNSFYLKNEKGENVVVAPKEGNSYTGVADWNSYHFTNFAGVKMIAKFIDGTFYIHPLKEDGEPKAKR